MELTARLNDAKYAAFRWRYELSIPKKLALAIAMAAFTGLMAQVKLVNPLMPDIPITGQTFAALLAAVLMGRRWGAVSMAIFAGLGFVGVPWFSGWQSGLGVTRGYIIGFIFAALFVGYFTDKYIRSRSFFSMLILMIFANFILIWIPGLIWRVLWLNIVVGTGTPVTFLGSLAGSVTYIPGDIIKAVAAAAIARGITPKRAFNGEVDKDKWAHWRIP